MKRIIEIRYWLLVFLGVMFLTCVKDRNFDTQQGSCSTELVANITYSEVKTMYVDQTLQIQEDLIIEGYVISSDEKGNFFSVLHFQNDLENPTEGFQIEIDQRDSHLFYPIGTKIYIKLRGLYLGKSKEVFKIGGAFTSFGNTTVGRLPTTVVNQHVLLSCDEQVAVIATPLSINDLSEKYTNTLVQFNALELSAEDQDKIFAEEREETERTLVDCMANEITLVNSGFSDFQAELLPGGNGTISGVLLRENDDYQLVIRTLEDINFSQERCIENGTASSNSIFISELADPENATDARFIELYNASNEAVALNRWKLLRYTNDNTVVSSEIDLSGFLIGAEDTFVISSNETAFEIMFGFAPDLNGGNNSPADSNGDDNIQLVDPFGEVIDMFGVVGEDGSNTNHEFEDGRALRKIAVQQANAVYTFNEWQIFNDTGAEGTINTPQIAPDDFTPGTHQ